MPFTTTHFRVETADGHHFRLIDPVVYYTNVTGKLEKLEIPVGTEFDGASTPAVIWAMIPPFGDYYRAACLHDFMYRNTKCDRAYADLVFLEAMENLGVAKITRELIYHAVRAAGGKAFENDRNEQAQAVSSR